MTTLVDKFDTPAMAFIARISMIISVLVIMYLAGQIMTMKDNQSESDKQLAISITRLSAAIDKIEAGTQDRYTSTQAEKDFSNLEKNIDQRFKYIEDRLDKIEDK